MRGGLLTQFSVFLFYCIIGESLCAEEYPKVSVLKWMSQESYRWEYDNLTSDIVTVKDVDSETIYTVAQHIFALSISCNASFPVQWIFKHFDRMRIYSARVKTYRQADDFYNVKSYKYSSVLIIYSDSNKVTGEYSCQRIGSEKIQNSIYVYWLGGSPPYFIHSGKTLTLNPENNTTLILPCLVSTPDVESRVILTSQNETGDYVQEYPAAGNSHIKFDPKIGFTITLPQIESGLKHHGHYKCTIDGGEDEDFVTIVVVPGKPTVFKSSNIFDRRAVFQYDKITHKLTCCSTSSKPPNMLRVYCSDVPTCQMREYSVLQGGNSGFQNENCTYGRLSFLGSGVVRCKGDGIDIVRHYFSSLVRTPAPPGSGNKLTNDVYFDWKEANPVDLIEIKTSGSFHSLTKTLYANQTVTFICQTSTYYFAQGLRFALKWRNQTTIQFVNETLPDSEGFLYFGTETQKNLKLVAHMDMVEATCFAPVWNSTTWVNKTYPISVRESVAAKLEGSSEETVKLSVGQTNQSISCVTHLGDPEPDIIWTKNDRILINDNNTLISWDNGSSTITFRKISLDVHGEYTCGIKNYGGSSNKIVKVEVNVGSSTSWGLIVTIITLVLVSVGVIGVIGWKMNLQKKIINHLTSVMFKDVGDYEDPDPPNARSFN